MNAQEISTLAIEGIFWVTVAFLLSQFITGLFVFRRKSYTVIQPQTTVTPNPTANALTTYCYEQLPDPWILESEVFETNSHHTVISFPTLRLLPPAKEVQPQPKRATRSKKTSQPKPKSPNKSKTGKSTTPRKPVRPRKEVA